MLRRRERVKGLSEWLGEGEGEGEGGGAAHLDRKHRGDEQESEVSMTKRRVVVVVNGVRGGGATEVPSPLLTEPCMESAVEVEVVVVVRCGRARDRDQGESMKKKNGCAAIGRGEEAEMGETSWGLRGKEGGGAETYCTFCTCSHHNT